jgi:hypothetical protein
VSRRQTAILLTLSLSALSGCGTTRRFVDQPPLTVEGADTAHQAAVTLFGGDRPYRLRLCDADPVSKDCRQGSDGIRANGVGGLFLPLVLTLSAMTVTNESPSPAGWAIEATVQSKADAISPLCRIAHGRILERDNGTISIQLKNFYCNWVIVGNVLVNTDLSIDHIDPLNRIFTGFYKITFHGTGNAAGSGYYKALVLSGPAGAHADGGGYSAPSTLRRRLR